MDADKERITVAFRQKVMGQKKLVLPVRELLAIRDGVEAKARQRLKIGEATGAFPSEDRRSLLMPLSFRSS